MKARCSELYIELHTSSDISTALHEINSPLIAFRENNHVRFDAEMMGGEKGTGPIKTGLHLVERKQGSVAPAKLLGLFEVAGRRQAHAALSLDRFQHENREALRRELAFERLDIAKGRRFGFLQQRAEPVPPESIRHE